MMWFISFLCLSLPLAFADDCNNYSSCDPSADQASPEDLAKIEFRIYTGRRLDEYTRVRVGDALELCDKIDNRKPTDVYVFGYGGYPEDPSTEAIVNAYLARGGHNILLFDWSIVSLRELDFAGLSADSVGSTLAMALDKLAKHCLDISGLQLIGFSLGAVISGAAGRTVNFQMPQITGLDPAGPGFEIGEVSLNTGDAKRVFIIHTDDGTLGSNLDPGHADFFVNGGFNIQPGCEEAGEGWYKDICSHYRACYLYAESVRNEGSFIGVACDSFTDFLAGSCSSHSTAVMGYGTPNNARGRYYLRTNSESPYSRAEAGEACTEIDPMAEIDEIH